MYLVVGLGNPGPQYAGTRHNVGFEVVDGLAAKHGFDAWRNFKKAQVARGTLAGQDVLLIKPQTFMNLSGEPVGAIAQFYKVPAAQILVVHDELDFLPGTVRFKPHGGAGGHNGLRSLIAHVGADFPRLRMGVGKPPNAARGADYVLSPFDRQSRPQIDAAIDLAYAAVDVFLKSGLEAAMGEINRR